VSRVGGRDVEADGGTAAEQEKRCRALLEAHGLTVGQVFTDLDESGGKESRPSFDAMKERIERGQSGGVIVWKLSRFGRRVRHVLKDIAWIEEQGAAFVCVEPAIDTSNPYGRFMLTVFAALDELELENLAASWVRARSGAVENGIHGGPIIPAGYDRDPQTRRLVPNEHAPAIKAAFEARARGASWTEVAQVLTDAGVPAGRGKPEPWILKSTSKLLENRVYRGEARSGTFLNPKAHESLVSPGLWARVQARKRQKGSYATDRERPLLSGLIRCATCGGAMSLDTTTRNGRIFPFYRCKGSRCSERASIGASKAETYIVRTVLERAVFPPVVTRGERLEYQEALTVVDEATAALDEWWVTWEDSGMSMESAQKMAASLERGRDEAIAALNALPVQSDESVMDGWGEEAKAMFQKVTEGPFKASPELLEVYHLVPKDKQRAMLQRALESVSVRPGRGAVEERVNISIRPEFLSQD